MKIKLLLAINILVGLFFICNAQDKSNENYISHDSIITYDSNNLNGHRFISSPFIISPFINTNIRTSLGAGQTNILNFPSIELDSSKVISPKGDLAFTYADFEYQQAVQDWIAFSLKFNFIGRLGTDVQALLRQGVNLNVGYSFGWLIKLYKNDNSMLSGVMRINSNYYTLIDLYGFAQGIADSGKIAHNNPLISSTPTSTVSAGVSYAYAINKTFGITASGLVGYGESPERFSEDEWYFTYGIYADADLNPDYSVPIGLALSYFGVSRGEDATSTLGDSQNLAIQVNYTGKNDIDLGLVFNYQWFKNGIISNSINFTNFYLDIKYYFF